MRKSSEFENKTPRYTSHLVSTFLSDEKHIPENYP